MTYPIPLRNLAIAGLVGELAFEAYAWLISPALFGVTLAPANLVVALTKMYLGLDISYAVGFGLHILIGALLFPTVLLLTHWATRLNWILSGGIAGVALWFTAQGVLAPMVGRSFMMDFGAYTQSSFIAHIGMALVMGIVLERLTGAREDRGQAILEGR